MVDNADWEDSGEKAWDNNGGVVFLNNAGQAPLSSAVQLAGLEAMQAAPWQLSSASADQQRIRELFASLIDANPSDIAIMPSTAFAITMAARNLQRTTIKPRKTGTILVLQDQFSSAIYPWQKICDESEGSIELDIVPHPTETGWTDAILARLNSNVLVACLPPLHWSNGSLIDLERIGVACRDLNIPLVVDATQVVGIMPFSVQKVKPVFLACSVHKWLRGPAGASLVYVSKDLHSTWMPLDLNGRSRDQANGQKWDASTDVMGPNGYPETFFGDARKFDSGGKPNPILLPMLRSSMEKVVKLNLHREQLRLQSLMKPLLVWAQRSDFNLPLEPHASHIIGLNPRHQTHQEMQEIVTKLKRKGIIVALRVGGLRISPYIDTTPEEIQRLVDTLSSLE